MASRRQCIYCNDEYIVSVQNKQKTYVCPICESKLSKELNTHGTRKGKKVR